MINHTPWSAVLVVVAAACSGCGADASAAFVDADGTSIAIELRHAHRTLAEYDRKVILVRNGAVAASNLVRDSGGYAAANLYRCAPGTYMIDSYGERLVIDAKARTIQTGVCPGASIYLGIFDGGGSKPWRFFPSSQRAEKELVMLGA